MLEHMRFVNPIFVCTCLQFIDQAWIVFYRYNLHYDGRMYAI